jgi:hypothetical protein
MVKRVSFHRFKQFPEQDFGLHPSGVSLLAGGNNAGKSSILHGLAIWEFCRTAIEMERGPSAFLAGTKQGLGLGDDQFSPIAVPSLKHLWTNLTTPRDAEPDGYTLKIGCEWDNAEQVSRKLEFGLALANDRLFVKATDSNLAEGDAVPRVAYLPPFAGITSREMRLTGAIRRRRIGEGLAGAVLRNLLLDMVTENLRVRTELRGTKSKLSDVDLRNLRAEDPWELLQATLRETFKDELVIAPFREEYHSYIQVEVVKGEPVGFLLKRHKNYKSRDVMVEGSGFLQWLSVYTLALNINVLLFDEPDAHLHTSLQEHLLERLAELAERTQKQVLVATHSSEILRHSPPTRILEVRKGGQGSRYLVEDEQKIALLAGLGSDYAPRVDRARKTKRLFFVEGSSDVALLRVFAEKLAIAWPDVWVEWRTAQPHKERAHIFRALREEIPDLVGLSLVDRDDGPVGGVGANLQDMGVMEVAGLVFRKWRRRHIESYLIWPQAIAAASGMPVEEVERRLRDDFAVAISQDNFIRSDAPDPILDLRGKAILKEGDEAILAQLNATAVDVARAMEPEMVPTDIRLLLDELILLAAP